MHPPEPGDPEIHGIALDPATRCAHFRGPSDIVAIRMKCCDRFYACRSCHDALADHDARVWPAAERDRLAVRCGACRDVFSIGDYLRADDRCPRCGAGFNPRCRLHHHLYFE